MRLKHGWVGIAAVILCVVLVGCTPSVARHGHASDLTQAPQATSTPTVDVTRLLADSADGKVWVRVYAQKAFHAAHGCGCTVSKTSDEELFPKGTPVMMLRISLSGIWSTANNSDTQDVTGLSLRGTKFDGRPELAVLDIADGKKAAQRVDLPWLAAGLFKGESAWEIDNDVESSFVAAWYVPQGVDRLLLTVPVPTQAEPNGPVTLTVNLPADVTAMLSSGGE
jgi:hypothetical protein